MRKLIFIRATTVVTKPGLLTFSLSNLNFNLLSQVGYALAATMSDAGGPSEPFSSVVKRDDFAEHLRCPGCASGGERRDEFARRARNFMDFENKWGNCGGIGSVEAFEKWERGEISVEKMVKQTRNDSEESSVLLSAGDHSSVTVHKGSGDSEIDRES